MYKILFVDDERNVLEYLPLAICWEELGITQIFTASDAESALRIVKKGKTGYRDGRCGDARKERTGFL